MGKNTDYGQTMAKSLILFDPNSNRINGKHGQGTHSTQIGTDKLAENTPNTPKFIALNYLPNSKSLGFQ
jgi:hypothetical protein